MAQADCGFPSLSLVTYSTTTENYDLGLVKEPEVAEPCITLTFLKLRGKAPGDGMSGS